MPPRALPEDAIRLHVKRGKNDCAIAALASYLGRDYEEVLIAASKVSKHFWTNGLNGPDHIRVARRLGFRGARWTKAFDVETERGVLWLQYHDSAEREHSVVLIDGLIFDPDHSPPALTDCDDYLRTQNAKPEALFTTMERR